VRGELPSVPSITRGAWHLRMRVRKDEVDDRREKWRQTIKNGWASAGLVSPSLLFLLISSQNEMERGARERF
jgi:hypothetical protein